MGTAPLDGWAGLAAGELRALPLGCELVGLLGAVTRDTFKSGIAC